LEVDPQNPLWIRPCHSIIQNFQKAQNFKKAQIFKKVQNFKKARIFKKVQNFKKAQIFRKAQNFKKLNFCESLTLQKVQIFSKKIV